MFKTDLESQSSLDGRSNRSKMYSSSYLSGKKTLLKATEFNKIRPSHEPNIENSMANQHYNNMEFAKNFGSKGRQNED